MGAKESSEMAEARRLITGQGMTAYAAAKLAKITAAAIYQAPWYRKHQEEKRAAKGKGRP